MKWIMKIQWNQWYMNNGGFLNQGSNTKYKPRKQHGTAGSFYCIIIIKWLEIKKMACIKYLLA